MTPRDASWTRELSYLIRTFPAGTRGRLWLYCLLQFLISLLDLAGLAAVMPVMQVITGANLESGYVGSLHHFFGSPGRSAFVVLLSGAMVLAFALKTAFAMTASRWSIGLIMSLQVGTASRLLTSYLQEDYLVQRKRDVGAVGRTIGASVDSAHSKVLGGVLNLFSQMLSITLIVVFLAVVAPATTLAVAGYFGVVVLLVQMFLGRRNRVAGRVAQETSATMSHAMLETIYASREIRMHSAQTHFVDDFESKARVNASASRDANFYAQAPKYLIEFATILGIGLMMIAMSGGGRSSTLMPTLTLFVAAAVKLMPTITALTVTIGSIRYGQEGLHITVDALKKARAVAQPGHEHSSRGAAGGGEAGGPSLSIADVHFRYPDGERDVLGGITFAVPHGTSVAVCGLSGSGKTTLIDIVLGLIQPTGGSVRFGELDVVKNTEAWLQHVAYVPQDVYLLGATLWENVAFGESERDVDRGRVQWALETAQLADLVRSLPAGIDALVGFKGTQLSGGQRQRLGIARALYRKPQVLVLDEATSALDNETEKRISDVLQALHGQVTTVLVAHRLSTVKHVDQVLFLEDGDIVARGSFSDVRRQSAVFDRLVRLGRIDDSVESEVVL